MVFFFLPVHSFYYFTSLFWDLISCANEYHLWRGYDFSPWNQPNIPSCRGWPAVKRKRSSQFGMIVAISCLIVVFHLIVFLVNLSAVRVHLLCKWIINITALLFVHMVLVQFWVLVVVILDYIVFRLLLLYLSRPWFHENQAEVGCVSASRSTVTRAAARSIGLVCSRQIVILCGYYYFAQQIRPQDTENRSKLGTGEKKNITEGRKRQWRRYVPTPLL